MSETCHNCGRGYVTYYDIPDDLWIKITGREDEGGLFCMTCLDFMARKKGVLLFWQASSCEGIPFTELHGGS